MRKIVLLSLVCIFLTSCEFIERTYLNYKYGFETVTLEKESEGECEGDCAEVSLSYIYSNNNDEFGKNFNNTIKKRLYNILQVDTSNGEKEEKLEKVVEDYLSDYAVIKNQFSEIEPYEITVVDTIGYLSDKLVSLESKIYYYTGMANDYKRLNYLNFKPDGTLYKEEELFTNIDSVSAVVKKHFVEKIIKEKSVQLDEDYFTMPESFGFEKDALILPYNIYEIAPYGKELTVIRIPITEVEKWLAFKI